ncbi:MAG: hypothetical protein MKZ59_07505 [Deinococcales bacterium]|nr:hypothetical protein [Deinococcales bacterium]
MLDEVILAIDPGLNIGIALVHLDGSIKHREIVTLEELRDYCLSRGEMVVVGNGTGSGKVLEILQQKGCNYTICDETNTSFEARDLYFQDFPPKGLVRFLPRGLWFPNVPIDDYAACVIARRYLTGSCNSEKLKR